ncbi:MAG: hypothetical protein JXB88_22970 [Spirochaetales bacterium]|nr:hypothetical protein [Spirochaetales bacterium]
MKKKPLLLTLFLCLTIFLYAQSEPDPGDVNWDGSVDIVDALLITDYYVYISVDNSIENPEQTGYFSRY